MTTKSGIVLIESPEDGIGLVRLDRPEARNALTEATLADLAAAVTGLDDDPSVRVVLLTGNKQAFAAGADLAEFVDAGAIELMRRRSERHWQAIAGVRKPMLAVIQGFALGGGLELAMCCDIILAGEGATLGQPEVKIGIMPGAGGTQRLTRAVGKFHAMRLCLTGCLMPAAEALQIGLVSQVAPDDRLMPTALAMAREIARLPPLALAQIKQAILASENTSLEAGLAFERHAFQLLFASADKGEGMRAFFAKRSPDFKGK